MPSVFQAHPLELVKIHGKNGLPKPPSKHAFRRMNEDMVKLRMKELELYLRY